MKRAELVALLGTSSQPTTGEVRHARRALARRVHPDAAGGRSSAAMAELNAACDDWLAEIRTRRDAPVRSSVPSSPSRSPRPATTTATALPLRYGVAAVVLVLVILIVVVALAGFSLTSLAAGALLGAGAAAVFAMLMYQQVRRAAGRR